MKRYLINVSYNYESKNFNRTYFGSGDYATLTKRVDSIKDFYRSMDASNVAIRIEEILTTKEIYVTN